MTQAGTLSQKGKIQGLSDHSGRAMQEDLTNPQEVSFFKDRTGQQREREIQIRQDIETSTSLAEVLDRIVASGIEIDACVMVSPAGMMEAIEATEEVFPTRKVSTAGMPIPYIVSLLISTAVSTICGASIYLGVVIGKTLFDPYTSLFWFLGGIGIILISLKGISIWRSE